MKLIIPPGIWLQASEFSVSKDLDGNLLRRPSRPPRDSIDEGFFIPGETEVERVLMHSSDGSPVCWIVRSDLLRNSNIVFGCQESVLIYQQYRGVLLLNDDNHEVSRALGIEDCCPVQLALGI